MAKEKLKIAMMGHKHVLSRENNCESTITSNVHAKRLLTTDGIILSRLPQYIVTVKRLYRKNCSILRRNCLLRT